MEPHSEVLVRSAGVVGKALEVHVGGLPGTE